MTPFTPPAKCSTRAATIGAKSSASLPTARIPTTTLDLRANRPLLLTSDISVYTITVGTALLKHEPGRMTNYAKTPAATRSSPPKGDLERLYSAIGEQARNQYTLAYAPHNPGVGDYHTIEVRVERPGMQVSSREGYYASAKR